MKGLVINDEYMEELLKYDFKSSKKGRGMSSILIRDMHKMKRNREGQNIQG